MHNSRYKHSDIRKNPELQEWFCAKYGAASDHTLKEDAIVELSALECSLHGATSKRLIEKERDLREYHLSKLRDSTKKR